MLYVIVIFSATIIWFMRIKFIHSFIHSFKYAFFLTCKIIFSEKNKSLKMCTQHSSKLLNSVSPHRSYIPMELKLMTLLTPADLLPTYILCDKMDKYITYMRMLVLAL